MKQAVTQESGADSGVSGLGLVPSCKPWTVDFSEPQFLIYKVGNPPATLQGGAKDSISLCWKALQPRARYMKKWMLLV